VVHAVEERGEVMREGERVRERDGGGIGEGWVRRMHVWLSE
jgi:hypothetical protein